MHQVLIRVVCITMSRCADREVKGVVQTERGNASGVDKGGVYYHESLCRQRERQRGKRRCADRER
jgi:hypothetical protein